MAALAFQRDEPSKRHLLKETIPKDADGIQRFVKKHGLYHGDVVASSEMRDMESFIIHQESNGKVSILSNPDDSAAGYLTIPAEVLLSCKNSYEKYKNIISESAGINLHMAPHDTFLTKRFGNIPNTWKFDVYFAHGELEEIFVSTNNVDWHTVNAEGESVADIEPRLEYKNEVEYKLPVELKGDTLEKYKMYKGTDDYAWLKALPDIPATWRIEKGESAGGKDWHRWEWILSGTKRDERKAIESVGYFFKDIPELVDIPIEEVDPMQGITVEGLAIKA